VSTPADESTTHRLAYLAQMARGYDNHLKWNEVAKLKADLMNVRHRWLGVSAHVLTQVYQAGSDALRPARHATRCREPAVAAAGCHARRATLYRYLAA